MRGVGRARTAGDEAYSWPPSETSLSQSHDRRAGLLTANGQFDRRIIHGVEGGEVGFAGNAVDALDPLRDELVDKNLSARSQSLAQGRASLPVTFRPQCLAVRAAHFNRGLIKALRLAHEVSSGHSWAMS